MCNYRCKLISGRVVMALSVLVIIFGMHFIVYGSSQIDAIKPPGSKLDYDQVSGGLICALGLWVLFTGMFGIVTGVMKHPCLTIPYFLMATLLFFTLLAIGGMTEAAEKALPEI